MNRKLSTLLLLLLVALGGNAKELNVLQLNIWQEGTVVKGGFEAIADEITHLNPDVVLLSEVRNYNNTSFIHRLLEALKERGKEYHGQSSTLDVGILSKYPIKEQRENYPLKNDAGSVLKARLDVEGQEVVVYSAHLDYTNYACYLPRGYCGVTWKKLDAPVTNSAEVEAANRKSLRDEAIQGVIDDVKNEKANLVILGGDFNEPSHLDWTEATRNLFDHRGTVVRWDCSVMLARAGFKDSYRECFPNPVTHPGFTFPSYNADAPISKLTWAPEADERDRIDYIYYLPSTTWKLESVSVVGPSSSVVRNERVEEATQDHFILPSGTWPTDHKGVMATFRLENRR